MWRLVGLLSVICTLSVLSTLPASAAGPVGVVLKVDGEVRLEREGRTETVTRGTSLLAGDVLIKPAGAADPEVRWWPYAGFAPGMDGERRVVVFTPPVAPQGQGMIAQLKEFMGFVDTEYEEVAGVSDRPAEIMREPGREEIQLPADADGSHAGSAMDAGRTADRETSGAMGARPSPAAGPSATRLGRSDGRQTRPRRRSMPVLPGRLATVLPRTPVPFGWLAVVDEMQRAEMQRGVGGAALVVAITDEHGRLVVQRDLPATAPLELEPAALGLEAGKTWRWALQPVPASVPVPVGELRLLSEADSEAICADLARIASAAVDQPQRLLEQAAYLQFASDLAPDRIDLYWLSARLLDQLECERPDAPELGRWRRRLARHLSVEVEP